MAAFFPDGAPKALGAAVSGGGDSTALCVLLARWCADAGTKLSVVTVDHGLRDGSAAEADAVCAMCKTLGLPHSTLKWDGWSGRGNLQDAARKARRALIAGWAGENNIFSVAFGHTADDQAETVLMRLGRGSGVDGLSGMDDKSSGQDVEFIRPLLTFRRRELRDFLRAEKIDWLEDPSNDDPRFERIKARRALESLSQLGITVDGLVNTAARMRSSRRFIEGEVAKVAANIARVSRAGDVLFNRKDFAALDAELQYRLMAHALKWVASAPYRPRQAALQESIQTMLNGEIKTLGGCQIVPENTGEIRVFREYQAVKDLCCGVNAVWDLRWQTVCADDQGLEIRPIGEDGMPFLADWRQYNHPRASVLSAPSIWRDRRMLATVFEESSTGLRICLKKGADHFYRSVMTH